MRFFYRRVTRIVQSSAGFVFQKLGFTVDFFKYKKKLSRWVWAISTKPESTLYSISSNLVSMLICISALLFPADSVVMKQRRLCIVLLS